MEAYFDSIELLPIEATWPSQPKIHESKPKPEQAPEIPHAELARWLIVEGLGDPSKLNTFFEARLTRDLMYKSSTASTGGMYFNESSQAFAGTGARESFDFNIAYDQMKAQCNRRNQWEQRRFETMKQRNIINGT